MRATRDIDKPYQMVIPSKKNKNTFSQTEISVEVLVINDICFKELCFKCKDMSHAMTSIIPYVCFNILSFSLNIIVRTFPQFSANIFKNYFNIHKI